VAVALTFGVAAVGGTAWFLVAWLVAHEPAGDAVGEALGVAFGVLIVASVIGAVRGFSRRAEPSQGTDSTDPPEHPETNS
jgi:hypothetical protein